MILIDNHTLVSWFERDIETKERLSSLTTDQQKIDHIISENPHLQEKWSRERVRTWLEQGFLITYLRKSHTDKSLLGKADGIAGPRTLYALQEYHKLAREDMTSSSSAPDSLVNFPVQSKVKSFYGEPGNPDCQRLVESLYPLRMDGSLSHSAKIPLNHIGAPKPITRIALHVKLHESFHLIQQAIIEHYGTRIPELGLDQYAGSYNYRPMRGGTNLSMHAWGIAIDWDAQRNGLHQTLDQAQFGKPDYKAFLDIWEAHGWLSLGRARNYDSMHVQAARL